MDHRHPPVTSRAHRDFWAAFDRLPASVQQRARQKYRLRLGNPRHPSLHFKKVGADRWSARVNRTTAPWPS
jgi:hypothetical protein